MTTATKGKGKHMTLRTSARRAAVSAALAAALAAMGTTAAEAKQVALQDDTSAEFAQGTTAGGTVVRDPGTVELARTFEEPFDGTAPAPASWTSTPWPSGGTTTVGSGAALVDGALLKSTTLAGPGSSVEFTGDLGAQPSRHVGFADFDTGRWAIFSTGNNGSLPTGLYARMSNGTTAADPSLTVTPGPHRYRVDWTVAGFVFYVDDVKVTPAAASPQTDPMPFVASDFDTGAGGVSVDAVTYTTRTTGTFVSRVLDSGDKRVTAITLAGTAEGAVAYETRTADTLAGLDSATWTPVGAGGAVAGAKRYLRYRATLTTPNPAVTPKLGKVAASFTVDDIAPVVTVDGVDVSGKAATVRFTNDDAAAAVACSLDGGAFAACTSPVTFSGLAAGAHTVAVRATDAVGNAGTATKQFTIAAAQTPSGGTPNPPTPGPGTTAPDTTAPKVLVLGRSLDVSSRGVAALKVRCPRSETSCTIKAKLKVRGRTVARRTLTLASGESRTFRLKLSRSARSALAKRSKLAATAVVAAVDAAGNRTTLTRSVTLHD